LYRASRRRYRGAATLYNKFPCDADGAQRRRMSASVAARTPTYRTSRRRYRGAATLYNTFPYDTDAA